MYDYGILWTMETSKANLSDSRETILITGATGLIGSKLVQKLASHHYRIMQLSRSKRESSIKTYQWDIKNQYIDPEAIREADYIIHLAGSSIADGRWTATRKQEIYQSRVASTKLLFEFVRQHHLALKHFISASAIGYYGWDTGDQFIDEDSEPGTDFLAEVVRDWEKETRKFSDINIPNSAIRIGLVLSTEGGALVPLKNTVKYFVGAPLASGKQYMSWIHIDDLVEIFAHVLINRIEGVVNGVAPHPVTNIEFTKSLAKQMHRPVLLPHVPSFALKLMLGEMSSLLIGGNRVSSKKIEALGFKFQYPTLNQALRDLL